MRFVLIFLLLPSLLFAQKDSTRDFSIIPLPVIFQSPETSFGFGIGAFSAFRFKNQGPEDRSSSLQLGGAYTLNKQFLSYLPFDIYLGQNAENYLKGEVGYYKYFYYYWGVGGNSQDSSQERFDVNFPRFDFNFLKARNDNLFLGPRFYAENYQVVQREDGGLLDQATVVGSSGGWSNGLGAALNYDTRDHLFFPRNGWRVDASILWFNGIFGSDFHFLKSAFDVSYYLPIGDRSALGFNLYQEYNFGEVPFNQMSMIGGSRKHRGYYKGRYRDHHMLELQAEVRFPVFWRCGAVLFAGIGDVWGQSALDLGNLKWNLGIGGRFMLDRSRKVNARGDLGFGKGQYGTYITVGEAF